MEYKILDAILEAHEAEEIAQDCRLSSEEKGAALWFNEIYYESTWRMDKMPKYSQFVKKIEGGNLYYDYGANYYFLVQENNVNESKNMNKKNTIRLTESELKKVITESVKRILKENFYDFDYDSDELSQFDRVMDADEYLKNEVDFANDGEYIDKLRYQIKGSQTDKKEREFNKNYEDNKQIINSLSKEEYEFLTYVIDEGNITSNGDGIDIDMSIDAWKEGTTGIKDNVTDGAKIINALVKKGVGTIHNGILWFSNSSIVDMIECEHNYWRIPNFKPVRYWSK